MRGGTTGYVPTGLGGTRERWAASGIPSGREHRQPVNAGAMTDPDDAGWPCGLTPGLPSSCLAYGVCCSLHLTCPQRPCWAEWSYREAVGHLRGGA